jgi:putative aldouronate transport system permease protein
VHPDAPAVRQIRAMKSSQIFWKNRYLFLLFAPGALYFIVFHYVPMVGITIAFQDFDIFDGFFASKWVGLRHFTAFVTGPFFWRLIRNTLLLNVYGLLFSFPIPILFALLLNEVNNMPFKRVVQTISYLPYFVSTVVIVGLLFELLSPSSGALSLAIARVTGHKPVFYMAQPEFFRGIYIASGIWQSMGWSAIIYLAALSGVNPELYEAAIIDGVNRFQKILYVTIPALVPTITVLFILNLGHILSVGFEKVFLMQNSLNMETADVIATFVYRRGLLGEGGTPDYSFATAVNMFSSVIGLAMIFAANSLSRRVSENSLW